MPMIVGYGRPRAVISGSVSAALRRVSSASSARTARTACRARTRPRAAATRGPRGPGTVSRNVIAPACATTTSRFEGSVMIAMSPVTPARIAASVPCPPSSSDGHERDDAARPSRRSRSPARAERPDRGQDRRDAALHVAGAAAVERAIADLAGPRIGRPGRRVARRDDVEVAGQDRSAGPPARPGPPDDHGQRRSAASPRRASRVGPDRSRVRRDRLDRETRGRQGLRGPRRDRLLGPGDARDPDERGAGRRRAGRGRSRRVRQPRRIGRVMQVGPPEPLIPISVAG